MLTVYTVHTLNTSVKEAVNSYRKYKVKILHLKMNKSKNTEKLQLKCKYQNLKLINGREK